MFLIKMLKTPVALVVIIAFLQDIVGSMKIVSALILALMISLILWLAHFFMRNKPWILDYNRRRHLVLVFSTYLAIGWHLGAWVTVFSTPLALVGLLIAAGICYYLYTSKYDATKQW